MMNKVDLASKVILYSEFQQLKNDSSETNSLSIPSSSYNPGDAKSFSFTIPVTSAKNLSQVYAQLSTNGDKWYNVPFNRVSIGSSWNMEAMIDTGSSTITVTLLISNPTPDVRSSPAVTVTAKGNTFIAPF